MQHLLTEEQQTIRDLARTIAEEKVKPVRAKYDEENIFPWDIVEELAKADLFRVFIPAEYDGLVEAARRHEHVPGDRGALQGLRRHRAGLRRHRRWARSRSCCSAPTSRRRSTCPRIAAGKKLAAFGLTEPNAGSDAGAHPDHRACATATTTSSTAPSSGSPTAARPTSTPSSP